MRQTNIEEAFYLGVGGDAIISSVNIRRLTEDWTIQSPPPNKQDIPGRYYHYSSTLPPQ